MSKASQTHPSTSQRPVEGTSHPPGSWPLVALSVLQGFSFPPFESPDILSSHPSVSHLSPPHEGKGFSSLLLGVRHIHVKQAVCVMPSVLWDVVGPLPAQFPWPPDPAEWRQLGVVLAPSSSSGGQGFTNPSPVQTPNFDSEVNAENKKPVLTFFSDLPGLAQN